MTQDSLIKALKRAEMLERVAPILSKDAQSVSSWCGRCGWKFRRPLAQTGRMFCQACISKQKARQ